MFSEKSVRPKSCLWGYGVLILLVLMGSMAGCSSRAPETDKLYSSVEEVPENESGIDKVTSSNQPPAPDTFTMPAPSYSSADREVVLRYVEKGESDPANLSQALKLVERAEQLSHAGRTMEDYLVLAAHYRLKGDMNQVVQHANQGIMSKSDNKRVKAYMFIYLGYTYEKKSPTMARSYFKQASQIDPGLYKGHYESGRIAFEKKEYDVAQEAFTKVLDLNLESADVYGMLGQMFYAMNQYEKAAEALENALAMSPQTNWINLKLGDTYFYGLKQREEGGRYYQQAVSKIGSDPESHFKLALYYRYKSEYQKADEHLQKAMILDHKNPKYNRELQDMNSEKNEMASGTEKYRQTISANPGNPGPVAQLGRYYLRWGKYDKAEEQYKKAVQLASKIDEMPIAKPDPEQPAESVVKEPSKVPELANNLGWFYFNDNKYVAAEKAFKTALKVNPKHAPAQFGLGRTYESMKQYDLAASHYAQTVALDPENKDAKEHLANLKQSAKLTAIGEVVKPREGETGKNPVVEVKK
jgi:tetratricopeptide (TPR) repeat protein